jgi:hypothetical protein
MNSYAAHAEAASAMIPSSREGDMARDAGSNTQRRMARGSTAYSHAHPHPHPSSAVLNPVSGHAPASNDARKLDASKDRRAHALDSKADEPLQQDTMASATAASAFRPSSEGRSRSASQVDDKEVYSREREHSKQPLKVECKSTTQQLEAECESTTQPLKVECESTQSVGDGNAKEESSSSPHDASIAEESISDLSCDAYDLPVTQARLTQEQVCPSMVVHETVAAPTMELNSEAGFQPEKECPPSGDKALPMQAPQTESPPTSTDRGNDSPEERTSSSGDGTKVYAGKKSTASCP